MNSVKKLSGKLRARVELLSISDDDVCSSCRFCRYNPGGESGCAMDWPGEFNADGYIVGCESYSEYPAGTNWTIERVD